MGVVIGRLPANNPNMLLRPARELKGQISLQRIETNLPGVFELRPRIFSDERGFFMETYHAEEFAELGVAETFVQDNQSRSVKGTVRGLHYQLHHAQAKLCRVLEGEAFDVVVDIRLGSPHFGKWTSLLLSAEKQNQIYIPIGFAHGFVALTDKVDFLYKCSSLYDPKDAYGVVWNDPELNIPWGIASPLVSEKDAQYPKLSAMPDAFLPRYPAE
jgi:dTDP-4-dehydrorhamnose 3,5-epimerase